MLSLIIGIVLIAFAAYAVIPKEIICWGLGWGQSVIDFLMGAAPVLAALIGIICLFIGAADIKDKKEARREELENRDQEKKE